MKTVNVKHLHVKTLLMICFARTYHRKLTIITYVFLRTKQIKIGIVINKYKYIYIINININI